MGKKKPNLNQSSLECSAFYIANNWWDKASFQELEASVVPAQHPPAGLGPSRALAAQQLEYSCQVPRAGLETENASDAHKLITVACPWRARVI